MHHSMARAGPGNNARLDSRGPDLRHVLPEISSHLRHHDRSVSVHDRRKQRIRHDEPHVRSVLQTEIFDIGPDAGDDLGGRERGGTDDHAERRR